MYCAHVYAANFSNHDAINARPAMNIIDSVAVMMKSFESCMIKQDPLTRILKFYNFDFICNGCDGRGLLIYLGVFKGVAFWLFVVNAAAVCRR